jgi:hypothetical protein
MQWLFFIALLTFSIQAQNQQPSDARLKKVSPDTTSLRLRQSPSKVVSIFKMIETGIRKCNIDECDREFGSIVTIAIGSSERSFYSRYQASSVLSEYFSRRKPVVFEFSHIHEQGSTPYATGRLVYVQKGNQESVQVYVSLTKQGARWVVNQFNIY